LARLLAELRVDGTFTVATGRLPAVGRATNLATASEQAHRLATNPVYTAETGGMAITVTKQQSELLVANGAANGEIQMIRTFMPDNEPFATFGFSDHCKACRRWIWCGRAEREAICSCGQTYRVTFDLAPVFRWTQRNGQVCTHCGTEHTFTEPTEGRNPWRNENLWQPVCNRCYSDTEVTVLDGDTVLGKGTYFPPGQPNGPRNPFEGLLLATEFAVKHGGLYTVEHRGRRTNILIGRTGGGGAYIVTFPKKVA
jgi:hypothetical protein